MPAAIDIAGMRFGRLVAVRRLSGSRTAKAGWLCVCDCGATTTVPTAHLTKKHTQSCGCLKTREVRGVPPPAVRVPLTAQRLRELLDYDPQTGLFTVKAIGRHRSGGREVGAIANAVMPSGYVIIGVDGRRYRAHRLAWLYVTGRWPTGEIDHINGNRSDNRFLNLRDVTGQINTQNQRKARAGSASGYLGVTKKRKRWQAQIGHEGKHFPLGVFDTPEEAHAAYLEAKRKLHPGCTI